MQPTIIISGKIDNDITRMLNITVDAPAIVIFNKKLTDYPVRRKRELDDLKKELDEKIEAAEIQAKEDVEKRRGELQSVGSSLTSQKKGKLNSIQQLNERIDELTTEIDALKIQIKKDTRAIRWMNTWRVIWGILCTAGIAIVFLFIVYGVIMRIIVGIISIFSSHYDDT